MSEIVQVLRRRVSTMHIPHRLKYLILCAIVVEIDVAMNAGGKMSVVLHSVRCVAHGMNII